MQYSSSQDDDDDDEDECSDMMERAPVTVRYICSAIIVGGTLSPPTVHSHHGHKPQFFGARDTWSKISEALASTISQKLSKLL